MIPIDSEGYLMWENLHWLPYLISFPSIYRSSKTEPGRARVSSFMIDWSWNLRWAPTSVGLGLHNEKDELDTHAGPPPLLGLYVMKKWCPHHSPFLELKSSSTEVDRLLHWMTAMMAPEEDVHFGAQSFAKADAMAASLLEIYPPPTKG